jgi:hypothetical protein
MRKIAKLVFWAMRTPQAAAPRTNKDIKASPA